MPSGRYALHDPHDGTPLGGEHFQCAPGPSGWRYVAQRHRPDGAREGSVDLTLDALGRPLRLELGAGAWRVRAGALDGVTWVRTDPTGVGAREGNAPAHTVAGGSPAFLVAAARLLRLSPDGPESTRRLRVVAFTDPVLAPRTLDQSWTLLGREDHDSGSGTVTVDTYRIADLETGELRTVHLAGDIVLAAPGVELEDLDGPPSPPTTAE